MQQKITGVANMGCKVIWQQAGDKVTIFWKIEKCLSEKCIDGYMDLS